MVGKKLFLILLIIGLFLGCSRESDHLNEDDPFFKEKINRYNKEIEAPDFTVINMQGETVSLSELRGKSVLVNFWASWCGPCVAELPSLINLVDKVLTDNNIVILLINVGEKGKDVDEFIQSNGFNLVTYLDEDKSVSSLFGVRGIPTTLFIDSKGNIAGTKVGAHQWDRDGVIEILKSIK